MWDLKLQPSANETPEILEVMADNVVHLVLERFKTLEWIGNWDGKPFNNMFLVRKPGVPSILFAQENGREVGIAPASGRAHGKDPRLLHGEPRDRRVMCSSPARPGRRCCRPTMAA